MTSSGVNLFGYSPKEKMIGRGLSSGFPLLNFREGKEMCEDA